VRIVGEDKTIPLERGYFELRFPEALLRGNPETIALRWVDFYRG
jgi:hypothetical protein